MLKKIGLLLFVGYWGIANAQVSHDVATYISHHAPISVYVKGGLLLPFGKYTQYNDNQFGSASLGAHAGLEFKYKLRKWLNIYLGVNYSQHGVNIEQIAEQLWEQNKAADIITVKSEQGYKIWNASVGVSPKWQLTPALSLDIVLGTGLLNVKTPHFEQVIGTPTRIEQQVSPAQANAWSYMGQANIAYQFKQRLVICAFAEVNSATPTMTYLINSQENKNKHQMQYGLFGLKAGYQF